MYGIVPTPSVINVANVSAFRHYIMMADQKSRQLRSILDMINHHVSMLDAQVEDLHDEFTRLRNRRMATDRGVPAQEVEEFNTGPQAFNISPSDAQVCVRLWRILAKRLHPDNKETGNAEQFRLAKVAYETRDLLSLQYLHSIEFNFSNLYWVSENWTFAKDRYERLLTQIAFLKSTPDYDIAVMAMQRNPKAVEYYRRLLQIRIANILQGTI